MTHSLQVKAKQSFYHDLVGSRAYGEVFQLADTATLQHLEQAGYVERYDADSADVQKAEQRQQEMGQAQAKANESVSQASHVHNMEANRHTQQLNQEAQSRAQQRGEHHTNEADQRAMEQQQKQFQPTGVSPKATAKKANEKQ